jgi:hypothetical protein
MNKAFSAVPAAVGSSGFLKAFLYSFGSWLAAWAITWLASSEAATTLGQFGWVIPLLNTLVVFFKQYFDAYQKK